MDYFTCMSVSKMGPVMIGGVFQVSGILVGRQTLVPVPFPESLLTSFLSFPSELFFFLSPHLLPPPPQQNGLLCSFIEITEHSLYAQNYVRHWGYT